MKNVTVYSMSNCAYCDVLKQFLNREGIEYKEVSVDRQPDLVQMLLNSSGQMGLPQTEIEGQWIVGYHPDSILKALDA
ncbi:glutaredoxin family protein [Bacillus testis]|uniref:glutaredoxin family protein n=1 Tax=Bacillus testis TaxID=1622072 RepID=UPI00067E9A66|nr:glutaredoxin family protein [Bacillus testis]